MGISDRLIGAEGKWLMGRFIPRELLKRLGDHLTIVAPDDGDDLLDTIKGRSADLIAADQALVGDGPNEGTLAMCAVVLAAYESLEPRLGEDRAILLLRHVFGEVLQRSMETLTRVLTDRRDPLSTLDAAMQKSSKMYGDYFEFEFERPDDDTFEMRVTRCFFLDFFERHGQTRVTTVLCAWDANWMRAIDTPVTGLRAERSSLMSLGSDACRFSVVKSDDPLARYEDVLDQPG